MGFFNGCSTVAEIKKTYRELALRWHPDRPGGDTQTMQRINAAYHAALRGMDGQSESGEGDGGETRTYTYRYKEEVEQTVIDMIAKTIRSGLLDGGDIELWLIGSWLWLTGNTKPARAEIRSLGYHYRGNRKAWAWHDGKRKYGRSRGSLADIARKYGAEKIVDERRQKQLA